ncbi:MAG: PA0069 family radical SAM protein [Nitrospirae bacterium]|nr:PA0069 family radical SAM protein [Nitrospirota bacterium]
MSNPTGCFEPHRHEPFDDGWEPTNPEPPPLRTTVTDDHARSVLTRNNSPDIPFDRSINPYRGCEHGCIYCFARASHAYLGMSAGLDFESRLFAKPDAPTLLRRELGRPRYVCKPIAMGTNTDPYQPVERERRVTRGILEVLLEYRHPVTIVTKSALVERDLDILVPMAGASLAHVTLSVTTLDRRLARRMEPRACAPVRRLQTVQKLVAAGVPAGVLIAPVIPGLTDVEIEAILAAAAHADARWADYALLRLPKGVDTLFEEWLEAEEALRSRRVLRLIRQTHHGRRNDAAFHRRQAGTDPFAQLIRRRFELATRRLGIPRDAPPLDVTQFRPRRVPPPQLSLFG